MGGHTAPAAATEVMGGAAGFHHHVYDGLVGPEGQKLGPLQTQRANHVPGRVGQGQLEHLLRKIDGNRGNRSGRLHGGLLQVDSALNFDISQRGTMMPSAPREESIPSLNRTPGNFVVRFPSAL